MSARRAREKVPRRGRKRGVLLLLIAALVVGGSVAASQLTTSTMLDPPQAQPVPVADSGSAYCPVIGGQGDAIELEIASTSLDEDSEIVITRYADGMGVREETIAIAAGTAVVLEVSADQAANPVVVEWRGGPVVAQYRLADDVEQAVAPCPTQPSDRWFLAGFDTNRGSTSTLYLFNPFGQDAVVSLEFGTPEGPVGLVIADQIQVPAGTVVPLDLAELRPETADLAVSVRAQVGRVIAQGQVMRGPAGEGLEDVTGRALVSGTTEPSSELFVPEALVDDVTESWVTVYNPSDRPAAVQVQVTTPLGDATALAAELTVPAGGTARIDLAGLSALPRLGVRIQSVNGIGLVASRVSAVQDGDRLGVAVAAAAPLADTDWTVVGVRGDDAQLVLFNPGAEVATASVDVTSGAPDSWSSVTVPPNGITALPLEGEAVEGPAIIRSDVPIVAGAVNLSPTEATAYWSVTGTATTVLIGGGEAVPAERDPALSSVPVISATATPTPPRVAPVPPGEGELDPVEDPTFVPPPTVTPTPSPGVTPVEPDPAAEPAPVPTPEDPAPPADDVPVPAPGETATEEGDLF